MDFTPLIAPLAFVGAAQLLAKFNLKPITASCLAVLPPLLVALILRVIYITGYNLPFLPNFLRFSDVVILILQLIAAAIIFRKLSDSDDSLFDWFAWTIGGLLIVVYIIPFTIHQFGQF